MIIINNLKAFINPFEKHDYASVVIQGDLDIENYVEHVNWLNWGGLPYMKNIMVSASPEDTASNSQEPIENAYIVAQRLSNAGVEVFIKNEHTEEWEPFKNRDYTKEYMYANECVNPDFNKEEKYMKERIELSTKCLANNKSPIYIELETGSLKYWKDELDKLVKNEENRKKLLKELWETKMN